MTGLLLAAGTPAANQEYLLQARQMQALSLAVHIPLVCFGIAFPALVLFVETLYLRTGDPLYRTLAMRWSKVMITLFAVGVVTGTILSFEFGLLWPQFMSSFGNVFGLGFAFEGFSFFLEAIFIAIYVYAWDRISPRKHLACGVVVVITGVAGSLMVIAVNGWMNHPSGFTLVNGRAVDVHPWSALFGNCVLLARDRAHVPRRLHRHGLRGRGRATRGARCAGAGAATSRRRSTIPLAAAAIAAPVQVIVGDWVARDVDREAAGEARGDRGPRRHDDASAPVHILGWYDGERGALRDLDPAPALVPRASTTRTRRSRVSTRCRRRTARPNSAVNVTRFAFQTMVGIGTRARAARRRCSPTCASARSGCRSRGGSTGRCVAAGPASVVALIAGWVTTEVGRQPWVVFR